MPECLLIEIEFHKRTEKAMINLFISQYFVTNKRLELLPRTDFGKSEEKTDLLTKR